ncbi:MAG: ADOP family duplicated permease [Vicinamibacteraceae bacterium]
MTWLRRLVGGLGALLRRDRMERELDEELRAYLEASSEAKVRAGVKREEAIRAAWIESGGIEAAKDRVRDVGWESVVESCWRDVRYAGRMLRKSPGFTAAAVLTLALGIGANTAIFSAVNAIILRQLPVDRPEELISLAAVYPNGVEPIFSYAAYRRIAADGAHLIDALAASTTRRDAITIDEAPEPIDLKWASGNYFTALRVSAASGRTLLPSDDRRPPGSPVAVLSDAYWARRFGRDPAVVGRSFSLNARTFTIVGIAPRGFFGESPGEAVDLWMPLSARPDTPAWVWSGHSTTWLRILARRGPGVSLMQARAGLASIYGHVRDEMAAGEESSEHRASVLESRLTVSEASGGSSPLRDNLSRPLLVLMAIVGLVLLVACANVANLMLARAATRIRETTVCLAIGAGRLRLIRQAMAEALLLAAFGGVGGMLLAMWGTSALASLISSALPLSLDVSPDMRVLAFAMLTSCATAVLFGLLPAIRVARVDPLGALRAGGGVPGRGTARIPLGRTLVVTQIVVSLVLVVAAGLFVRSLLEIKDIEPGFDPSRVLLVRMTPPVNAQSISVETRRNLYRQLLARAESIPGVEGASASFSGVLSGETWRNVIVVEGFVPRAGVTPRTFVNSITPRYPDVMRIAILRGRGFTDRGHETVPKVAIVNETFARQFFGRADALGKRVELCPCGSPPPGMMEIIGIMEDAKYVDLREESRPMLYVPFTQRDQDLGEIQVRTAGEPAAVAARVYRELAAVDSRLPVVAMRQARDQLEASIVAERLIAKLSAMFGLLALLLASVGLYGLIAYATTQRTGEIGIRMALGADRRDLYRLVLRDTFTLVLAGVVIGMPAALAGARLLASQLYEVGPNDPLALSVGLATLAGAATLAACLPARRAACVDPAVALRAE